MEYILPKIELAFKQLYGTDQNILTKHFNRFQQLEENFQKYFGDAELHYFSTPGRIEISGNHTDHNHGVVLASSIDLDSIAVVSKNSGNEIILYSEGYDGSFSVKMDDLTAKMEEKGTTNALIRGMASRFKNLGSSIGGLNICMSSNVLAGSGLSSSASFEVLIGTILNCLYNDRKFTPEELASIGQYAENEYFGKPCGLMDQMACAVGGIIFIDFKNPKNPIVQKVNYDFSKENYSALVVDTGGNHADLTDDYAAVPSEMKAIANEMEAQALRDVSENYFIEQIPDLRKKYGDRAVLRSLHFFSENKLVLNQVAALEANEFSKFLKLVKASGNSSFKYLQNIYTNKNVKEQGIALSLALTEKYLAKVQTGACRVHGGGFAGTILVFLPKKEIENYLSEIEPVFGKDCAIVLSFRQYGTIYLNDFE